MYYRIIGQDLPDPSEPATIAEIQAALSWYDSQLRTNVTLLNRARAGGYTSRAENFMTAQKRLQSERQIWRDAISYALPATVALPFNHFAISRGDAE